MGVNHIFIFCENLEESASELIKFGFIEGSNRIHKGQGTKNRKFYFKNFYLELLCVSNIDEIKSELTAPSKLYERSIYKSNGHSPFGLCLDYDKKDDKLFDNHFSYKPEYLPSDMKIEVLTNEQHPTLPWTFRWQTDIKTNFEDEPLNLYTFTNSIFRVKDVENDFIKDIFHHKDINIINAREISLTLEFDNHIQNKAKGFKTLPLYINM